MTTVRFCLLLLAASCLQLLAWNGYQAQSPHAVMTIDPMPTVTMPNQPQEVGVTLLNTSATTASGTVQIHKLADDWEPVGPHVAIFNLKPKQRQKFVFKIASGPRVYSIHYPVHVKAVFNNGTVLEAVRIFSVQQSRSEEVLSSGHPAPLPTLTLLPDSSLSLLNCQAEARMAWNFHGKPLRYMPVGFMGTTPESRAAWKIGRGFRPDRRECFVIHPSWHPGDGNVCCDFKLKLPKTKPIVLTFANAQRDSYGEEPQSDGITYKVLVSENDKTFHTLFEKHLLTKKWQPQNVSLSDYAGKTIVLRLESTPGPNRDTQVDSGYWADPLLTAGTPQRTQLHRDAVEEIARETKRLKVKEHAHATAVIPGKLGVLDALFVFMNHNRQTTAFRGFSLSLDGMPAVTSGSSWKLVSCNKKQNGPQTVYTYDLKTKDKAATLTVTQNLLRNGVLKLAFNAKNAAITSLKCGPWTHAPARYFFGHGYVVETEETVELPFGGHSVAASHAGAEFTQGPAVLQAVDTVPEGLEIQPQQKIFTLNASENPTFVFIPEKTAFKAAITYQDYVDRQPAGAVQNLAGRLVLDIWSGTFQSILANLKQLLRYDVTHLMLTIHNWQRWGYDYRLPDIWPPNPAVGTVDKLKLIAKLCDDYNIPWGLHDNYIDFYPDADNYSVRNLYFLNRQGPPAKAWLNRSRKAQSYKFRPDAILPFVKRNFKLITQEVKPSACFIDVFTSAAPPRYYDWDGNLHSRTEARKHWGEAFAWIRDFLGGNAPTTSEAGHDQLIGYLDGADCQWLSLSQSPQRFKTFIPHKQWERVPWADAVNHHRFAWIGVGYPSRFTDRNSIYLPGASSDDYVSLELLSGHNLMTNATSWGYQTIRKYWLAHDFINSVAMRKMAAHHFHQNNLQRQTVSWDNGSVIWVNRSHLKDWTLNLPNSNRKITLPPYGFYATFPQNGEMGVIKGKDGLIREFATRDESIYLNARTEHDRLHGNAFIDATPSVTDVKLLGPNTFSYVIHWDVRQDIRKDFITYVHFMDKRSGGNILFQDDHQGDLPTSQWNGKKISLKRTVVISDPKQIPDTIYFVVGLYSKKSGRMTLNGTLFSGNSIEVGTLNLKRNAQGTVENMSFKPVPPTVSDIPKKVNVNPPHTMVDFGIAATNGTLKMARHGSAWHIVPAPEQQELTLNLSVERLFHNTKTVVVRAEPLEPTVKPTFTARQEKNLLKLTINPKDTYKLILSQKP